MDTQAAQAWIPTYQPPHRTRVRFAYEEFAFRTYCEPCLYMDRAKKQILRVICQPELLKWDKWKDKK